MSPLVAAPNRGYQDWQRVENWDSPMAWQAQAINQNAASSSTVLDCSRFAYTAGYIVGDLNTAVLLIKWYADAAATVLVGERIIVFGNTIASQMQVRIPNQGPFVQYTWQPASPTFSARAQFFFSNRYSPTEVIPLTSLLIPDTTFVINGPGSGNVLATEYWAGPAMLAVFGTAGASASLLYINQATVTHILGTWAIPASGVLVQDVIIPIGLYFFSATTGAAGAQTFEVTLSPSTSGSG